MKRITAAALAALAMAVPLSAGAANAQSNRNLRETRQELRQERRDVGEERRDVREPRRDLRQAQRWNARQHNGYTYNGRWYYGQPTRQIMNSNRYEPGYRSWRRGDRLRAYERSHYRPRRLSPRAPARTAARIPIRPQRSRRDVAGWHCNRRDLERHLEPMSPT